MKQTDIYNVVDRFRSKLNPDGRFASFDYCYNYFKGATPASLTQDMEKSCLTLGFYLASWGMFRGSSFLLKKSVKCFQPTIEYIATLDKSVWTIDVDNYNEQNIQTIIKIYNDIKERLIEKDNQDLTLITKILLGVFGFIPAFDKYFCDTFRQISNGKCGFRVVNENSLNFIQQFYEANRDAIDQLAEGTFTKDFTTGEAKINYPKAKIIDMYGFIHKQNS